MQINSSNVSSIIAQNSESEIIERMSQHPEEAAVVYRFIKENPSLMQTHERVFDKAYEYRLEAKTISPIQEGDNSLIQKVDKISDVYATAVTEKPLASPQDWSALSLDQIQEFIAGGGDVDLQDEQGKTLLLIAAFIGNETFVQQLLQRGANPNISDHKQQSPLLAASAKGHIGIAQLLLQRRANPEHGNAEGHRAIHVAAFYGHGDLVNVLIPHCNINAQTVTGHTPLIAAAHAGHLEIVEALLAAKADSLIANQEGATSLEAAAEQNHPEILSRLVKSLPPQVIKEKGPALLHAAAKTGNVELLTMLLVNYNIDPESPNAEGETPLMSSIRSGSLEAFGTIMKAGANLEAVDNAGRRVLTHSMVWRQNELCQLLLENFGVHSNYTDNNGLSVVDYALLYTPDQMGVLITSEDDIKNSKAWTTLPDDVKKSIQAKIINFEPLSKQEITSLQAQVFKHVSQNVRRQCLAPCSPPVRSKASSLTAASTRRPVDLDILKRQDPQKWSRFQLERTTGSTTLTIGAPDERQTAEKAWESTDSLVRQWAKAKTPLSFDRICQINRDLNPHNYRCGRLRTSGIQAGESPYRSYVPVESVTKEMQEFSGWLEQAMQNCDQGKENPIEVAARAYQWLVSIHSFPDGNGRTSRMVMDYVLQRAGLPPAAMGKEINIAVFSLLPQNKTSDDSLAIVVAGVERSYELMQPA